MVEAGIARAGTKIWDVKTNSLYVPDAFRVSRCHDVPVVFVGSGQADPVSCVCSAQEREGKENVRTLNRSGSPVLNNSAGRRSPSNPAGGPLSPTTVAEVKSPTGSLPRKVRRRVPGNPRTIDSHSQIAVESVVSEHSPTLGLAGRTGGLPRRGLR